MSSNGQLSLKEVIEGLKISVDLDWRRIESDSDRLFRRWDADNSGEISYTEFTEGLLPYLQRHYPSAYRAPGVAPDITRQSREWFQYWDEDGSMSLERDEIARALIKTFRMTYGPILMGEISQTLDAIWGIFDQDGSGSIEIDEFISPDGLCDTILASLAFHQT